MEYISKIANLQDYVLSNAHQYFEMVVYTAVCFFIPLFIGHPQIVVGIVVNSLLIASALNVKGYKLLPVIISPALGAITRGVLFGPFTIFLLYMIPFIWIGNAILVFSFKFFKLRLKKNYWITLILGSLLKAGFLFSVAWILYSLGVIPVIFLTAMGMMQLTTAIFGGIAAYGFQAVKKKLTIQ
ncbi:hypothetical protein KY331_03055 [Candidatus Woesearchaeota archaeon]|nr:hypothetical protein [Candidatus Woesearchaeota archaeon]